MKISFLFSTSRPCAQEKRWLAADNVALLVDHIHTLRVRGAPLIGLSASLLLALLAQRGLKPGCTPAGAGDAARGAADGGQPDE
ncbi:methylthioribose-1-phosphate isomerase [Klebsiella pneumoniae subsp. rhinoscleromatis]|nr:methylthioribose-1-phosphate isomerase [Klebsiella pneumoniae subsp. rhinoscleromatis]